jgi:RNA polymerase sigma-70 factor (ECF subfamily)
MTKELNIQAIQQAQAGNMQSLSAVAEQVRQKVGTYIYRLTLDYHLTQDLTQETVLEMIKALPQLEVHHVSGFWGWIFRTALGKVQHHFRLQGARRLAQKTTSDDFVLECQAGDDNNPMNALVSEEIRKTVLSALQAIKIKYRNILILRCFENLSYGQIAGIMGGSEVRSRLLFFRAKHSLKNQLERHGFKRDHLLAALTIFAGLTLRNGKEAAAGEVVLASSLETELGIGLASLITAKTVITAACVLCVAGFTVSMIKPGSSNTTRPTSQELYSHLYPLLDLEEFVFPSRVIDANDPDKDGLLIVEQTSPESSRESSRHRLEADQITIDLANQPRFGPALPKGHWIELGFDGPIRDGSGPDLLLRMQGCRSLFRVFLTDGAGRLFELRRPLCLRMGVCRREHIIDYDLDGLELPFEPRGVRLLGAINWGPYGGIRFYSVQARIQKPEPSQL